LVESHRSHFIAWDDDRRIGFAILRGLDLSRAGCTVETDRHRLWLGVFPDNARARRAYEQVGFCPEGIARGSAFFGGVFGDELIMTILRPEWEGGLLSTR
jgi:RimJ/RimL family protein N-acetyltransferase